MLCCVDIQDISIDYQHEYEDGEDEVQGSAVRLEHGWCVTAALQNLAAGKLQTAETRPGVTIALRTLPTPSLHGGYIKG